MPYTYASIAIVGRPNVGKSTLFNRLVGSRIAIEDEVAGVTRDRVLYPLTIGERTFDLIDTGGIGIVDRQDLSEDVENQIDIALREASALVFMVDARDGIMGLDTEVAERLRRQKKPVLLVASKVDTGKLEELLPSFHALGFGDPLPISAKQNRGIDDLEDAIVALLPPAEADEEPLATRDLLKIAFVGKRNAGKSTLVNSLVGAERVIVSDIPGTTRDSLDIIVERDGETFVAIDTAGLRKRGQMDDAMEFYGHVRSERSVRRADVIALMIDATEEISRVDKRICALILEEYKPCLIVLNKWDLAREANPDIKLEDFQKYVDDQLTGMWFCRVLGISAKNGENVWNVVNSARELARMSAAEVKTAAINTALSRACAKRRPKPLHGKIGKAYYATQIGVTPPTFLIFCNNPACFDENYRRFLQNQFRADLGYGEIPIKLIFRTSAEKQVGRYGG